LRRRSLRTHLLAAIGLIVALAVGLTLVIGGVLTRRQLVQATLRDVSHQADLIAERERAAVFTRVESLEPFLQRQGQRIVTAPLGKPSTYLSAERVAELRRGRPVDGIVELKGASYYLAARPVRGKALVLLRPKRLGAVGPYLEGLLIAAFAGAALAALASVLLARRIARPVRRVAEATRSLAEARSPELVPIEGALELATLAGSFNDMAAQLERARAAERSFLLSVSHELKTPLTAIRGYAEGLGEQAVSADEAAETIVLESRRLERLVGDLLDLARMNKSEFSVHREPIDLAAAAREVVRRYEGQARAFHVTLEAFAPLPAPACGDADRTLQVVSNLVENALRLTPPGGLVRVLAEPGVLAVEDTGPGLKSDELPRAFDRFFLHSRYGGERPVGTGLGLAIVKELTESMNGSVEVQSVPGRITRFVVRLPGLSVSDESETPGFTGVLPPSTSPLT
jgi:two-component system OmpR family sensor kinase